MTQRFLSDHINSIGCAKVDAKMIAGLLEVLAETGFDNARIAKDQCQENWWQQATYLAEKLREAVARMERDVEIIESCDWRKLSTATADSNNGGAS
jgi:hypothetical protein